MNHYYNIRENVKSNELCVMVVIVRVFICENELATKNVIFNCVKKLLRKFV